MHLAHCRICVCSVGRGVPRCALRRQPTPAPPGAGKSKDGRRQRAYRLRHHRRRRGRAVVCHFLHHCAAAGLLGEPACSEWPPRCRLGAASALPQLSTPAMPRPVSAGSGLPSTPGKPRLHSPRCSAPTAALARARAAQAAVRPPALRRSSSAAADRPHAPRRSAVADARGSWHASQAAATRQTRLIKTGSRAAAEHTSKSFSDF